MSVPKKAPAWLKDFFKHAAKANDIPFKANYKDVMKDFADHWDSFKENADANRPAKKAKKATDPTKSLGNALKKYQDALATAGEEESEVLKQSLQEKLVQMPQEVKQHLSKSLDVQPTNGADEEDGDDEVEFIPAEKARDVMGQINESMDQFNQEAEKRQLDAEDPLRQSVQRIYTSVHDLIEPNSE